MACDSSSWTREQDKAFEDALAIYSKDSIDRWEKIAAMVPGKTIEDIKYHFLDLVQDTNAIEAGHVPLPRYKESSSHGGESSVGRKGNHQFGKRPSNSCQGETPSISDQDQRKGMAWTEEEHRLFLMGLDKYGKGDWRSISRNYVLTRTPTQVASHAQKYFIRLNSVNKGRRRSSIHDITSVDGGDSSTLLGPITGQMVGGGSSSRSANRTPLGDRGVSNYVPPTIVESNNNLIIPPAEIPEEAGTPVELLYDVGAPIPNDAFLLPL